MTKYMTKTEVKDLVIMTKNKNSTFIEIYEWTLKPILKTKIKEINLNTTDPDSVGKEVFKILNQLDYKILDID